jgi:diguanylate cyclase (GGDEF)-like protein
MDNLNSINFELPSDVLDEIQNNIQNIIESFDISDDSKLDIIKKINFMYTQTKQLSITDSLTKLFNRRHVEIEFEREYKRAKRYNNDLSIAIVDIDFFKKVNDTYGHLCGDYVLKECAYLILQNFRQTDYVFRLGGEEFAIILTETPQKSANIPLERLRKKIENYKFKFNGEVLKITVSIGVSSNTQFEDCMEMLDDADKALYNAKNSGRNMVR